MNDEDKQLLREIHECLIGTLEKQGFIGETKSELGKLWGIIRISKYLVTAVIIPVALLVVEKVIEFIK